MSVCLVTGRAWSIGSHLVDALVQSGHGVRISDDFSRGSQCNLNGPAAAVEVTEGDPRNPETMSWTPAGYFVVCRFGSDWRFRSW